ncbi:MAG: molecular chaperone DnaJ [Trueperaceae bacterium]
MSDFYQLLGVGRDADNSQIKTAYRKLALQYHPDRNPGNQEAEDKFKSINEAYAVLADPQKRARYDRFGSADEGAQFQGDIFDIFASVFGGGFAGGGVRPGGAGQGQAGESLETEVRITLEQAREGASLEVELERLAACDRCNGERAEPGSEGKKTCRTCSGVGQVRAQAQSFFGTVVTAQTCPECRGLGETITTPCGKCLGSGRMRATDAVTISLPRGIDGGYRLRVPRQGNAGIDGGPAGDLYVYIELEPHEHFTRDGDDLHYQLGVGMAQAALGSSFEVPTMEGPEIVDLPPGTQPGTVLRLRGKGMPRLRHIGMGDQLITVRVDVPKGLSARSRDLLHDYAAEVGEPIHERETLLDKLKGIFAKRVKVAKDGATDSGKDGKAAAKEPTEAR